MESIANKTILVTGAGGRTGLVVVKKLLLQGICNVRALIRSDQSKSKLINYLDELGLANSAKLIVCFGDITKKDQLVEPMAGVDALIICSSAAPKLDYWSMPMMMIRRYIFQDKTASPSFTYNDAIPEIVDWVGQKNQIDVAINSTTVKHVVVVGSMGGTMENHFLNRMGNGNILLWKRKAELYLMESGLTYTILHPGGLISEDKVSKSGDREILIGIDDTLLQSENRSIPIVDVAEICVQSLTTKKTFNRNFDLSSNATSKDHIFTTLDKLMDELGEGKNCDYSKPDLPQSEALILLSKL